VDFVKRFLIAIIRSGAMGDTLNQSADSLPAGDSLTVSGGALVGRGSGLRSWGVCAVLFLGTFLLFSPALNHGFADYDDPVYVTQNIHVHKGLAWESVRWAFTTGDAANWHPLTWLSHMLDWKLYGDDPRGHHATSIFIHSLNAVLAFLMFRRLTGAFWTSAVAAALFAWHPLRVESVVWVAERKDVLSGFFGLATVWIYAEYAHARRRGRSVFLYCLTLLAFALGLLCKPMLVTLPFVLLLVDFWPLGRVSGVRAGAIAIAGKIPFFILSIASCIVTYRVQEAGGAFVSIGFASRVVNSVVSVARYLEKFFWPFGLAVGYPYPDHWPAVTVAISAAVVGVISLVALVQWRRRSWILVGWLWCLGMWVPVIGLVKVGLQGMADRYTYLPLLGVELALLWTLRQFVSDVNKRPAAVIALLVLLGCAARTWNQISIWSSPDTLYRHALDVTTDNYLAECYYASSLMNEGNLDDARVHLLRALQIKPDYDDARFKLGFILEQIGHLDEAAAQYRLVLAHDPGDGRANFHMAEMLVWRHKPTEAIPLLELALRANPEAANAWDTEGVADTALGRYESAAECFKHALSIKPENEGMHFHEAEALRRLGRSADAVAEYQAALKLNPQDAGAFFGLGAALEDLGQEEAAIRCYQRAVEIRPDFADAQYNLGVVLLNANRPDLARGHFVAAVQARNDDELAYVGLGLAEGQLGQSQKAIADLGRAASLNPGDADAHDYLGTELDSVGQYASAMEQWREVQRINPNYPGLAEQLQARPATNPATKPSVGNPRNY
jgi:tetratricopeptide (TPR) repeat protein